MGESILQKINREFEKFIIFPYVFGPTISHLIICFN